ncbi:MAG: hypothetical protein ABI402_01345 [Ferruginibacter sp.]
MNIICWVCIILNMIAGSLSIISENNKKQDAAGKNLMSIIGVILILFAGLGALFLYLNLPYLSLIILAAPTFIVCRQFVKLIRES